MQVDAACELFLTAGAAKAPALRGGADRLFQPPLFVPHAARFQRAPVQMKNLKRCDLMQVNAACELFLTAGAAKALQGAVNMAHTRQSRPDSGPGFPVQTLKNVQVVPALQVNAACELFLTAGAAEALENAAESLLGLTPTTLQ